ncbi:MAG: phosphoribosylanthranilate isomerase [Deltaproteobacteria bacterium]|nr:phosphoribosylanthranilate isomerase [Deltaproteobacteria bacterium]
MSCLVKICGLTNVSDTMDAIELGADLLGFNFYPDSPRYLKPNDFKDIIDEIPFSIGKVGVFVNADPQLVIDIATEFNLDYLQFHGDESPEYCNQFSRPFIKAVRPQKESDLNGLEAFEAEFLLVDAHVQQAYGGTGITANWDLARHCKNLAPILLAGGLNPENIEMAIGAVKPNGVDVASGIEHSPREKDYRKMEEFIKKAKGAG